MKIILFSFIALTLSLNQLNAQEWFKYSDFPVNVIPKDITVNNAGTLFMLATDNSIYYKPSSDNWQKMASSVINPNCISADENSNKLYVGTSQQGIMHTSNFGSSWSSTYIYTNPHTGMHESYNFISNIKNSNLFFATYLGTNQLVRFTNQGGNGQSIVVNPDTNFNINDLFYTSNNKLLVGSNQGVWISNNNGVTYTASGIDGLNTYSFTEDGIGNIYTLSLDNGGQNKLWISESDEYSNWMELTLPTSANGYKMVYFDKSSSMIWLADQHSIYKSPASSINWSEETHDQENPNIVGFINDNLGNLFSFSTENNCQLYSTDSWTQENNGLQGDIHQILLDGNDKLFAYNNFFSNKLASTVNGNNWDYTAIGTNGLKYLIDFDVNTILLSQWNKIYQSTDHGETFSEMNLPEAFADQTSGGIDLFLKGELNDIFITHTFITDKIFRSSNLGETWDAINLNDMAEDFVQDSNGNLIAVLFGANTGFVPEIQYSSDNGENWNILETDLLQFSSANVYLMTHNNQDYCQIDGKIYKISIADETLTEIPIPVTVPNNHNLQFKINDAGEYFIIDTNSNLYKSIDNGTTWQNLGKPSGVPNANITSLEFGFENMPFVIYKAYNSSSELQGIYYYGEEILSVTDEPSSNTLIYPNPVSGEFYVNTNYRGNLYLFDVSGKLIRKQTVNQNITKINIQSLPKGIYFLKLQNGQSYKVLKQ